MVTDTFTKVLEACTEEKHQLEYFLSFYVNERLSVDAYILVDDNGKTKDYTLYEDVSYTKDFSSPSNYF